jgi:7,8-dihydropterin-6-yl-methyl-4-(beta-D-ribofuranosyl)aminobenzene 5'-phosphate synthase
VGNLKVSVLIENQSCNKNLKQEFGLSLHINYEGKNILFDTGATGIFIENAEAMGINIEDVDFVVISHAHSDHAGGLVKFLERNKKAKVYMSKHSKYNYYVKVFFLKMEVGIPKEVFSQYEERIIFVNDFCQITKNVYVIPNSTERSFPLGNSNKRLFVRKGDKLERDNFNHEISLVIDNNNGLEIFTACSHNGISNMIEHARSFFSSTPIHTVVGGFHLMDILFKNRLGETKQFVEDLASSMLDFNIKKVYTAHCTGKKAYEILKETMGETITYIHTGTELEL